MVNDTSVFLGQAIPVTDYALHVFELCQLQYIYEWLIRSNNNNTKTKMVTTNVKQ